MLTFTKDSITQAIQRIDNIPELRKGRESQEYDLIFNNNKYPPILVLSEAHKILGGEELQINDFGNSTKKPFNILNELGFIIKNKPKTINKELIFDIVNLCEIMSDGRSNGSITPSTYTEKFKPYLNKFKEKFGTSPNMYLQNKLEDFYESFLSSISNKIDYKGFGYWGRSIYNYSWACIYYDFGKDAIPASFSPQLYILVNKFGIKFGFCYGHYIENDNTMVTSVRSGNIFSILKRCIENDKNLCFFNSSKEEITASPEKLFGKEERIIIKSDNDILNNWSRSSLLIKEFFKDEIPENIEEVIEDTLMNLKEFYLAILPITQTKPEPQPPSPPPSSRQIPFDINKATSDILDSGLFLNSKLITRFTASLITKPFVILTGLSGSGKTKLAQAFAKWICESEKQFCIVPVGADWTNREPLLGFPNALLKNDYIIDEYGVLNLILEAAKNDKKPYFLILDEMNLSHVERYFADFLSIIESKNIISLHSGKEEWNSIPANIKFPENLFIVGTVNIDETTYMFSPKVLDRANVIEFKVTSTEMDNYLNMNGRLELESLTSKGSDMAESFVDIAKDFNIKSLNSEEVAQALLSFFTELKKTGSEFGFRTASEILRFSAIVNKLEPSWGIDEIVDAAIMQKLLPKLHGSRKKLVDRLEILGKLCLNDDNSNLNPKEVGLLLNQDLSDEIINKIKYPISFEKISRMYRGVLQNGFTSYAEA